MLRITVDSSAVGTALEHLKAVAGDLTPVMIDISATLLERVSERFEMRRDPLGASWTPKKGERTPATLIDSQHMLNSRTRRADASTAEVGFGQPYAVYHEFGTNRMPRRGILFANPEAGQLSTTDEQLILDAINRHLASALGG
jgi:phage virion morphogenesis protein